MISGLLIILFLNIFLICSFRYIYYEKKTECEDFARLAFYWREQYIKLLMTHMPVYDKSIIEAVKYAVKKSHPDNGGNQEDFIKFKKCLDALEKNQANRNY